VICTLSKSNYDSPNNHHIAIFGFLAVLWAFGPSVFSLTNNNVTVASITWLAQYNFGGSSFSIGGIPNIGMAIILHSLRLLFIFYVMVSLGRSTRLWVPIFFGFAAEIPFIYFTVYYALFPPGGYLYYLTFPIPIIVLAGIFLLIRDRRVKTVQASQVDAYRT
jgi:hypothetical protein